MPLFGRRRIRGCGRCRGNCLIRSGRALNVRTIIGCTFGIRRRRRRMFAGAMLIIFARVLFEFRGGMPRFEWIVILSGMIVGHARHYRTRTEKHPELSPLVHKKQLCCPNLCCKVDTILNVRVQKRRCLLMGSWITRAETKEGRCDSALPEICIKRFSRVQ